MQQLYNCVHCTKQLSFLNATQRKKKWIVVSFFLRLVLFVKKAGPKPNSLAMSKFSYLNDQRKLSKQSEIKKTNTTNKWHLNENEAISHNCTSKWWLVVSYTYITIRRFTCLCSDPELDIINCFKTIYHAKCLAINTTECIEHKN